MRLENIVSEISLFNADFLIALIKLFLLGAVTFLAIISWNKNRDRAWTAMIGGIILYFVSSVFDIFVRLGLFSYNDSALLGMTVLSFVFNILPPVFFFLAFLLKILKR